MASNSREGTLRLPSRASAAVPMLEARCKIKATPNVRNVYYCGFPDAALPPEFSKRRPVIVVSYKNSLTGPVLVVPITTQAQRENRWAIKLTRSPTPGEACNVWVVCNHFYSACARLTATHGAVPRLTPVEFHPVHELIMQWLPALQPIGDMS